MVRESFSLTFTNDHQKNKIFRLMYKLKDFYIFIRNKIDEKVIEDLSDIEHYFQDFIEGDQPLPVKLLVATSIRAWGHAQSREVYSEYAGFCLVLDREDFHISDKKIFSLDVLDNYQDIDIRFRCTVRDFEQEDCWLIVRPYEYGLVAKSEKKRLERSSTYVKWHWARFKSEETLRYQLWDWPKVHNGFVRYMRNILHEFPDRSLKQVVQHFKTWQKTLNWKQQQNYKKFPEEMYSYLILKVHDRIKKGEVIKFMPRKISTFILLCEPIDNRLDRVNVWRFLYCPFTGKTRYYAKRDVHHGLVETVNKVHIMKIKPMRKKGNTILTFAVRPFKEQSNEKRINDRGGLFG